MGTGNQDICHCDGRMTRICRRPAQYLPRLTGPLSPVTMENVRQTQMERDGVEIVCVAAVSPFCLFENFDF